MKKLIIDIFIVVITLILGIFIGLNIYSPYDVNKDRQITAQDYVLIRNYIMSKESDKQ